MDIYIRKFQKGDEEGITSLIYENYGDSYVKEMFYHPRDILDNEDKKLHSIVAQDRQNGKIVGHFALVLSSFSNIAEIGVAVVSPSHKGHGIMNMMYDGLIKHANELKLDAVYGEALMSHIFSQKCNESHGMFETAIGYGEYPASMHINSNEFTKLNKRISIVVGYKVFNAKLKLVYLPTRYKDQIQKIYNRANNYNYKLASEDIQKALYTSINDSFDPMFNSSSIVIDSFADDFLDKFNKIFKKLLDMKCEIIFARINLQDIGQNIDIIIKHINSLGFFFSGILPMYYLNKDYLQLQYHNSKDISDSNLVCYTDYCSELLHFIQDDKLLVTTR